MYIRRLLIVILPVVLLITSCAPEHSKIVVAQFDDSNIYLGEFEKEFLNNQASPEEVQKDSLDTLKSFLDLYVNYKMKLRDAFVRGYTTDPDIQKEINDYKANIGSTLYLNDSLYEPNLKKLYDRRKWELRVSHIFLPPDSTGNDVKSIELAKQIIKRIKNGEDFTKLVEEYSKDQVSKKNGGDLYYVTAGTIPSVELENAIYNCKVGEVYPEPVKSKYGIHVLMVTNKIPRKPAIRCEHIMISTRDSIGNPIDTLKAYQKIHEIKNELDNGGNFEELAKKYSDDKRSSAKGGDVGFLTRGRLVREFDEIAFNLKKGEVSPVMKTPYGYHLLKVTDIKPIPPYEEEKSELKKIYDKYKYESDLAILDDSLKVEMNFVQNAPSIHKLVNKLDTLKINNDYWGSDLDNELGQLVLFSIADKPFSADSMFRYMESNKMYQNVKINTAQLDNIINKYENYELLRAKGMEYDKENKEFAKLMNDYRNGVYLFKILNDEVWSKNKIDSNMVKEYYEKTKDNYKWNERVQYKEIYVIQDSVANLVYNEIKNGADFDSLMAKFTVRPNYQSQPGYNELVDFNKNDLAKKANTLEKVGDISKPFKFQDGWSIVKLVDKEPARLKTFDEVKAEVASTVQENESKKLENDYINRLKKLYKPKYYYDELSKAFNK